MESPKLKVAFASINNGSAVMTHIAGRPALECVVGKTEASASKGDAPCLPITRDTRSFMVTALNCANYRTERLVNGYVAFTPKYAFLHKYFCK